MNTHCIRMTVVLIGAGLLTGCCGRKFDTWDLAGIYLDQDVKAYSNSMNRSFSSEEPGKLKDLKWLVLSCDRNYKITGMMGWTPDGAAAFATSIAARDRADDATFTPMEGRFETIVGTFDTRTGGIRIDDTAEYGEIKGVLEENRSITFFQKDEAVASVD